MEFAFTADEQAFREDIRQFLRDYPPEHFAQEGMDAGYGSGAHSHAFLRQLGARGWLSMCWPREYGGQERPLMYKLILLEELAAAGAPFGPLGGVDQVSESIIRYGSERLKQDLLPRAARGDITFWQGFSEPNAGSDLLLCESARKKENPSLERYITPSISTVSYIMTPYWDAPLTIASFSAELPVIRGHGRSPASSCLFVRDQKSAYASHFRPCWP